MSSQGTGVAVSLTEVADSLLRAWGQWARSGDLGMGYGNLHVWHKPGLGTMYSDEVLAFVDSLVAKQPPYHKKILVKHYIHAERLKKVDVGNAISSFAGELESSERAGELPIY